MGKASTQIFFKTIADGVSEKSDIDVLNAGPRSVELQADLDPPAPDTK